MKNEKTKTNAKTKVGVIGLGIMGSSISSNLQKSGFDVHGVDLSAPVRKKMKPLLSEVHADPSAILQHTLKIITSLPSSKALMHVCHALCESKRVLKIKGTPILMETSTLTLKDKMAAHDILLAGGIHMIDAPLSGTGAQANHTHFDFFSLHSVSPFISRQHWQALATHTNALFSHPS